MESEKKLSQKIGFFAGILVLMLMIFSSAPESIGTQNWKLLAVVIFMFSWWISEAVPIPVTALIPIAFLPLFNIMPIKDVVINYSHPVIFLSLGGFILALALRKWNLHSRIALNVLNLTGSKARNIIMGFMIATSFVSMWMSNTATTLMMLPIALSVIKLLKEDDLLDKKIERKFLVALLLSIAYSANIGGTATLIGTPTNAVLVAFLKENYNYEISFAKWMAIGLPFAVINLILCWGLLVKFFNLAYVGDIKGSEKIIKEQLYNLGKMKYEEKLITTIFSVTAFFWIFKSSFNISRLDDTIISMMASIVLFSLPVRKSFTTLLNWEDTKNLPWGILLLFGGGLTLASAVQESSMAVQLGQYIADIDNLKYILLALVTLAIILFLTECMSNMAITTLMLPIVAVIAIAFGENPTHLAIAITLASSCAFMLPTATPPNAVVFSSGYMHISDMVKVGVIMNIISLLVVMLFMFVVMPLF